MKQAKSRSYNQNKLKILSDNLCDKIDDLLTFFDLDYKMSGKLISMSCPIHGGDNPSAFNLYPEGDKYRGNWKCRTHGCEEVFKSSILGFIRGVLSHQDFAWSQNGDKTYSFEETIQFAEKFLNKKLADIKIDKKNIEKSNFANTIETITTKSIKTEQKDKGILRNVVRKSLSIPSPYFLARGFSKEILDKYDVGDCLSDNKEMSGRAVVPIYDNSYQLMIGCTGRSLCNKCDLCDSYHESGCPDKSDLYKYSKWKHSFNFKSQDNLYNFWFAKDFIKRTTSVIIVESPGNVWRLEEAGIHNSVALFGTNLSNNQKMLLDTSGAMTIIIAMDSDEAGIKASEIIAGKCQKIYNIKKLKIDAADIAEMSIEHIKDSIIPQINNI